MKNVNTHQNNCYIIEMLYIKTESQFMQQAKSSNGNSQAKKPKNHVFFSSLNGKVYQVTITKQS